MRAFNALATAMLTTLMISTGRPSFAASPPALSPPERLAARRSPVVQVFESCRDAVVNISSKEIITVRGPSGDIFQELFDFPLGRGGGGGRERQYTRTSVGSGFVIHPDGYIVTNAHVVNQTAERTVTFVDGKSYDAEVVASDPTRDLAVLKVQADKPLPVLKLGRSNDLMVGETVIAIGSPLGYPHTVTAGVVSAVGRNLDFPNNVTLKGLVQTDASINPGNSGGPLLNVLGELIGVDTAIRGDAQNIGFAIPVDQLREVLPDLLDLERRYRIVCGLKLDNLDVPRVTFVQKGSPAEDAGVRVGDVLTAIDDRPIKDGIDFSIELIGSRPDQTIALRLERDGKPVNAKVTLRAKPLPDSAKLAMEKLGIQVEVLPAESAEALGLPNSSGLWISGLERGGPADETGLQRRDVLVAIGKHNVASREDLGQLLEQIGSGQSVPVTVLRVDRRFKQMLSGEVVAR